ncbi:MAG: hypothetical protein E7280_07970 [Lachnospiraceae bacterium]|nr:hypothetical protein [Lachnospiraceae bacterium]
MWSEESGDYTIKILTDSGCMDAMRMEAIVLIAKEFGSGELAFSRDGCIEIRHVEEKAVEHVIRILREYEIQTGGTEEGLRPVASCMDCNCDFSNGSAEELGDKLQRLFLNRMAGKLIGSVEIIVDGCLQGCRGSYQCDIGIQITMDGYRIYLGGSRGHHIKKGEKMSRVFTSDEALFSVLDRLFFLYRVEKRPAEGWEEIIERIGMKEVERRVLA